MRKGLVFLAILVVAVGVLVYVGLSHPIGFDPMNINSVANKTDEAATVFKNAVDNMSR